MVSNVISFSNVEREKTAKIICAELNNFVDLKNTLLSILQHVKLLADVEAVSLRLQDNGDYPYFVYSGFPESFIRKESSLCALDKQGLRISEVGGSGYRLECICGAVIRGQTNGDLPYFTEKGSFWSNNTTQLLNCLREYNPLGPTRNHCMDCGYETLALVPIRNKQKIVGLIQLNDKRIGGLNQEMMEFLEMIGEQIGIAVENALIYTRLEEQKKELERTLQQLQEAQNQLVEEKKMASLGNLVAGVAHEINTPAGNALSGLYGIIERTLGFSKKIQEGEHSVTELQEYLQTTYDLARIAYRNTERIADLVQSFKRVSIERMKSRYCLFEVRPFLMDIIQMIRPALKPKKIDFEVDCKNDFQIHSFPGMLSQVFTNLIMNSFYHGFGDRQMGRVTISCQREGNWNVFTYSDDGCGIAEEIRDKIFDPFFTTRKKDCSGLGLHIVYNIINSKLKGKISCSSNSGAGATFVVKLPLELNIQNDERV